MTKEITCPGRFEGTLEGKGEGFGATRRVALDAARTQAKTKLDLNVANRVCLGNCNKEATAEPDYDSRAPEYSPWPDPNSTGFKCKISQSRKVEIKCVQPSSSLVPNTDEGFTSFPIPLLTDDEEAIAEDINTILAFVSMSQRTIFIKSGCADIVLESLEAVKRKTGWNLPNSTETFTINEVEITSNACSTELDQLISLLRTPQRDDRRVRDCYTCGPIRSGSSGPCLPVEDGKYYIKGDRTPIAFCRYSRNKRCVEYYRELGTVGFFEDSDCKKLIREYGFSGWTCLGLF